MKNIGEPPEAVEVSTRKMAAGPENCCGEPECQPAERSERASALALGSNISLDRVSLFKFDPLIHRMVDKYGWTEEEAQQCFEDTKKYLYLCASLGEPLPPSKKIDEVWHNFILFTMDYLEFCIIHFGRFIHHRPRRRDDAPVVMLDTASVARQLFGEISENWVDPIQANDDCGTCMSCKECNSQ